jgi:hypothetical protein
MTRARNRGRSVRPAWLADHLIHGEPLEHAGPKCSRPGPAKVLHGRDQTRLDPADAPAWPGDRDAGLGPGQKAQRLAGVVFENAVSRVCRTEVGSDTMPPVRS